MDYIPAIIVFSLVLYGIYDSKMEKNRKKEYEKENEEKHIRYLVDNYPNTFNEIRRSELADVKLLLNKDQLIDLNNRIDEIHKNRLRLLAESFDIKNIIELSNVDYVYVLNLLDSEKKTIIELLKLEKFEEYKNSEYKLGFNKGKKDKKEGNLPPVFLPFNNVSSYFKQGYTYGYNHSYL